ncbi:MAG: 2,3-bisphosphoglycerate-independent phosphoglycerate mutase [Candidatus Roizmanbacteria bacterium]|nr:MAG: 2,3-bisphosphoglycerate-independent phosphoglycerate mutase [Candidatus Roizmanbacteria bacterium]
MKSVILIVLDGFGIGPASPGNAIFLATPTNLNTYLYRYPNTTLKASGEEVGLPHGEVGNTEVGHINLGAGRIIYQDLPRINMSIADGTFSKNKVFLKVIEHLAQTKGKLHLLGLIGNGSVHSSIDHLYALLNLAKESRLKDVYIHAITDGRDSPPKSAQEILIQFEEKVKQLGIGRVSSVMGRYFAMDRDRRWERTEKAYLCLAKGVGQKASSVREALEFSYRQEKTDEFIEPTLILDASQNPVLIDQGDAVIFFNFRIDRPRQLTKAFVLDDFENKANVSTSFDPYEVKYSKSHLAKPDENVASPFNRGNKIANLLFVTMTEYEKNLPVEIAFPQIIVSMPLGRVISNYNLAQLRMSESEKERFVTYYFNGQRDLSFPLEDHQIIPSPKVATYDLRPEMSAIELTEALMTNIKKNQYKFILVNFANPDMVGHTGSIEATVKAIKTVDECVGKIVNLALELNMTVFITGDHGNAEQKINPKTGDISTEHTDNPVPFFAISNDLEKKYRRLQSGILADVAPTILTEMDIPKPEEMTGRNLLEG